MRIASRVFAYPALLFILAQKKPNEVCEMRAGVARGLIAKEACCIQNVKGDLTENIVRWYRPELVIVAKSGQCPKRLFFWTCDTQKVEVPPPMNAMEGTGREARERSPLEDGKGKEGRAGRAIKFKGLKFHSFHRSCVSSVGCSNAGGKLGAPENMQRCACHPKASCERSIKYVEVPSVSDCATLHNAARRCGGEARESFRRPAGRPR